MEIEMTHETPSKMEAYKQKFKAKVRSKVSEYKEKRARAKEEREVEKAAEKEAYKSEKIKVARQRGRKKAHRKPFDFAKMFDMSGGEPGSKRSKKRSEGSGFDVGIPDFFGSPKKKGKKSDQFGGFL